MSRLHDWRRINPRRAYKAHELAAILAVHDTTGGNDNKTPDG